MNDGYEESLTYINKILDGITFGFNVSDMIRYKNILLNEMNVENDLDRIEKVIYEMEQKGVIGYLEIINQ